MSRPCEKHLCEAMACAKDWDIECWDVVTAFLNSNLEENVYMHPPQGMKTYKGQSLDGKLLKIQKGLHVVYNPDLSATMESWYS